MAATTLSAKVHALSTMQTFVTVTPDIMTIHDDVHHLRLITYDQTDPKSAEDLLYEAASESDEKEAKTKWEAFTKKVDNDYLKDHEIQELIHNLDDYKQWSALHYAVANNNIFLVKILIGNTYFAATKRFECTYRILKFLLEINILGGNGENVLHVAARSNKLWEESVEEQLSDWSTTPGLITTVRRYVPQKGQQPIPSIVTMLINYGVIDKIKIDHKDDEGRTPLHLAVLQNRCSFAAYLLENGADLKAKTKLNSTVFHFIFIPNDPIQLSEDLEAMFNMLFEHSKNDMRLLQSRTVDNQSPLIFAMRHRNCSASIVKTLLKCADDNQLLMAFDIAAQQRVSISDERLELLIDKCLDLNSKSKQYELVHLACRHNHQPLLKLILEENRIDKNVHHTCNQAGYTPLLTAVFYGAEECVDYLLSSIDIYSTVQNDDGETILHILAKRRGQSRLFKGVWDKMKTAGLENVSMVKDKTGNLPLHWAARTNQLKICEQLLPLLTGHHDNKSAKKPLSLSLLSPTVMRMTSTKNDLGQTAGHVASEEGHINIIKHIWTVTGQNHNGGLFTRDDNRQLCLHVAAAKGHLQLVKYLLKDVGMTIDAIADRRTTPLHLACQYGRAKVITYLLQHEASVTLRNSQLYNCLEIAIMNNHEKIVQNILLVHPLWREMMRNAQPINKTKAYDTPMRKLIRYMPQLTIEVIDTKLTRIIGGPEQKVFKRTYDYEFFQDELVVERWYTQDTVQQRSIKSCADGWNQIQCEDVFRCTCCCFCCHSPATTPGTDSNKIETKPYTDDSYTLVRNHPLFIVAQQTSCPNLIQHPFNTCLRRKKFAMFGTWLFLLSWILYTTYLGVFTAVILQGKHPQYFYQLVNINMTLDLTTCQIVANTLVSQNQSNALKSTQYKILQWIAFGLLIIFILKNVILVLSLFPRLFRGGAYFLEASALILSFVYILDWYQWLTPVILRCPVQYQIGSFGLLLAWINFLSYLRCFPIGNIGIYVVMLQFILSKFLQFLPVLTVIICGFGFTFWMLLQNQSVYQTPYEALIRTSLMMFDLGYEDRLYKPSEGGTGYYNLVYVIFILTGIVLSIFVVNLMISLSVGEIPSLLDQSKVWRHQMLYNLLSDYEIIRLQLRSLVDFFTCQRLYKMNQRGPHICKFLQRRQDIILQKNEKHVKWPTQVWRYINKHICKEQIQEDVHLPSLQFQND